MALQGGEIHGEEFGGSMGIEKGVIWIYKKKQDAIFRNE